MLLSIFNYLTYGFDMSIAGIFGINQNNIKIYYNKNLKLFNKNLIDISLKTDLYIKKTKKHNLIFDVAVIDLEIKVLSIACSDFYLMMGIDQV